MKSLKGSFPSVKGWREIGGKSKYFKSKSEANYARYLEWQKQRKDILDWHYECETFWFEHIKRGCVSYLPDFKITNIDGSHYWVEVKGYMDPKSMTKISRFRRFYPQESLKIVDARWFRRNNRKMRLIISDWE